MIENDAHNKIEYLQCLEALLFVAPGLSSPEQLAQALEISREQTEALLHEFAQECQGRGIRLQWVKQQVQLVSASEYAPQIEKFLGLELTSRLTQPALEVLAIIAYKQPATRPDVDSIRGVNSDSVLRSLLAKGLIEELGRSDAPGRPILYGVTEDFLHHFGLESLNQLPKIDFEELRGNRRENEEEQRLLKD